jgi:hypothetical protein
MYICRLNYSISRRYRNAITHVICISKENNDIYDKIVKFNRNVSHEQIIHIVNEKWLYDCIRTGQRCNEENYPLFDEKENNEGFDINAYIKCKCDAMATSADNWSYQTSPSSPSCHTADSHCTTSSICPVLENSNTSETLVCDAGIPFEDVGVSMRTLLDDNVNTILHGDVDIVEADIMTTVERYQDTQQVTDDTNIAMDSCDVSQNINTSSDVSNGVMDLDAVECSNKCEPADTTHRHNKSKEQQFIFMLSCDAHTREIYTNIIISLGGSVIDERSNYNPSCSHIILQNESKRTEKSLCGCVDGKVSRYCYAIMLTLFLTTIIML